MEDTLFISFVLFVLQPNERTPLHTLVERKDLEFLRKVVELLPAEQRDKALNATDSNGNTCLHLAAAHTSNKKVHTSSFTLGDPWYTILYFYSA